MTEDEQLSYFGRSLPFLNVLPQPNANPISLGERMQLLWLVRLEAPDVPTPQENIFLVQASGNKFFVKAWNGVFAVQQQLRSFVVRR